MPTQVLTIADIQEREASMISDFGWSGDEKDFRKHAIWTLRCDYALDVSNTWPKLSEVQIAGYRRIPENWLTK